MKESYGTFPFNLVTFIFIIFNTLISPLFGNAQFSMLFLLISACMIIIIMVVGEIMLCHQTDLPIEIFFAILIILPVVSSWIIILTGEEKKQVVSAGLSESIIIALISSGGTILAGVIVGGAALYKVWKDSKTISSIEENVKTVKAEVTSARGSELKNIETHTSDIHKNMLSKVIPGMEKLNKLDNISEFVTRIDANTKNDGGNIPLIFSEVNKMVEKMNSLKDELETEKRESQEKDQKYLVQISTLRQENEQLKQRNKELEYSQGRHNRGYDIEL
ncbi:MAG: hypothetical protein LBQ71_02310 [Hungatella sp.]|jgi:vacuolar-type H+-ATPase subunit I/STV1|nr:hypothetical protein [Hungatella sp.]